MAQIPNADTMKVASHEVIHPPGTSSVQAVLSGAPHPRAMILEIGMPNLASFTAQLLRALSDIDRGNLVIGLRQLLKELTGESVASEPAPDVAAESDAVGIGWLTRIAAGIQSQGRFLGLSDQVIAGLIPVALRDEVVVVLADRELGRQIADPALAASRAGLLGLSQQPPWTVQLGDGRSLDVDPDLDGGKVAVFTSSDAGSRQVMSLPPEISYRLGVVLQVASWHVARGRGGQSVEGPVPGHASAALPGAPSPQAAADEDPRAR